MSVRAERRSRHRILINITIIITSSSHHHHHHHHHRCFQHQTRREPQKKVKKWWNRRRVYRKTNIYEPSRCAKLDSLRRAELELRCQHDRTERVLKSILTVSSSPRTRFRSPLITFVLPSGATVVRAHHASLEECLSESPRRTAPTSGVLEKCSAHGSARPAPPPPSSALLCSAWHFSSSSHPLNSLYIHFLLPVSQPSLLFLSVIRKPKCAPRVAKCVEWVQVSDKISTHLFPLIVRIFLEHHAKTVFQFNFLINRNPDGDILMFKKRRSIKQINEACLANPPPRHEIPDCLYKM